MAAPVNILHVTRDDLDVKKWNEAILRSEFPLVFAQAFYLDATSPGWSALVANDYQAVMPVTAKKKYGIRYVIQPPFTSQLGLFGPEAGSKVKAFLSALEKEYKYIDIELNASNSEQLPGAKNKRTFVIRFKSDFSYNSNTRRNIAKASKLGLKVEEIQGARATGLSKKHIHPFLKNKLEIKPAHIRFFEKLIENSLEQDHLRTFAVRDEGQKLCALAHYISNGRHALYLKGTNTDRNSGSMHLLMHHAVEFFREKKVELFDFGGGQNDSLAQFYQGFGAKELNYKIFRVNRLPGVIRWLKR
jgi:hypothetical protein